MSEERGVLDSRDQRFGAWLARKSWRQGVRFATVVGCLIPLIALLVDIPILRDPERSKDPAWLAIPVWHALTFIACAAVVWIDRYALARFQVGTLLTAWVITVLAFSTAFGLIAYTSIGDFSVFAAGAMYVATVLCTPRHIRRPMYFVCAAVICGFIYLHAPTTGSFLDHSTNPVLLSIVAWQLDVYTFERNSELFREMERAEEEKARAEYERARADKVLYNVFPESIADELKRDEKVNAIKFESMGVMFTDIVGFTSFSRQLPPDALVFVLNQIFSMFDRLVDAYELEKIKTIGDAYMVVANKKTDSLARLALDMLGAMRDYNTANGTDFQLRIGMHVGPAVAGVIGVKRFLYDVWGDTVNVASRMESTGEPGKIHVTQAVQSQLGDAFSFVALAPIEVKGKGTMSTFFLTASAR